MKSRGWERLWNGWSFNAKCGWLALGLVLLLPAVRVVEACGRLYYLPEFYDSFWHALTAEGWFTELWYLYSRTWFGWAVAHVLFLWLAAILIAVAIPLLRWRGTFCVLVGGVALVSVECMNFRLESYSHGQSDSQRVWCLRSRDPSHRREAARGMSITMFKFGAPPGTHQLARTGLSDEVFEVRLFAVSFLGRHPTPDIVPELIAMLNDPDLEIRQCAVSAVSSLGKNKASALPTLRNRLPDGELATRASVAEAYLRCGGDIEDGLPALKEAATSKDAALRAQAGQALAAFAPQNPQEILPVLANLLDDDYPSVRSSTLRKVGDLKSTGRPLIPALLKNLEGGGVEVQSDAASALGQIGSDEDRVIAALSEVLADDPSQSVRYTAAHAIGSIGSPKGLSALGRARNDPSARVRETAQYNLQRLGLKS